MTASSTKHDAHKNFIFSGTTVSNWQKVSTLLKLGYRQIKTLLPASVLSEPCEQDFLQWVRK